MANSQWMRGDVNAGEFPFVADATITFNVGDLVCLDTTTKSVRRMISTDTITTAINQFLGVCAQKLPVGGTRVYGNSTDGVIRVDTSGVFEFDTATALTDDYDPGEFVGFSAVQTVKPLGSATLGQTYCIGVCVKDNPATSGRVQVRIHSRVVPAATPMNAIQA